MKMASMKRHYVIYCDGAYSHTRKQSGAGLVIYRNGQPVFEYAKCFKGGTNNTAELCAIILSLKCFKNPVDSILIVSDSQYCIGCINDGWSRNANLALWNEFDKVYLHVKSLCDDIKFVWIKGHSQSLGNIRADELAVQASQSV